MVRSAGARTPETKRQITQYQEKMLHKHSTKLSVPNSSHLTYISKATLLTSIALVNRGWPQKGGGLAHGITPITWPIPSHDQFSLQMQEQTSLEHVLCQVQDIFHNVLDLLLVLCLAGDS